MVPSVFVPLKHLPLTTNGKVDTKALPDPEQVRVESGTFVAPSTPTEKLLADIWTQVLRVEKVGIHDNFFELGGDSILSIQIIAKANQAGLQLMPKQMFDNQTIAKLATVAGTVRTIQAEQGLVTGDVFLTPIQHWFFEQNQPEPHHYNQAILLEMRQNLDTEILQQVMQQLYCIMIHCGCVLSRKFLDGSKRCLATSRFSTRRYANASTTILCQ
jgi:hypothetical protein